MVSILFRLTTFILTGIVLMAASFSAAQTKAPTPSAPAAKGPLLFWTQLSNLDDREGFAAMFAGVTNNALLVAGGANFPDERPWEGGAKRWYDDVWLLDDVGGEWKKVGKLPKPNAYGVSGTVPAGVVCAGGGNATEHFADVFLLSWKDNQLAVQSLPPLPKPCAFASGTTVGNTLYVAGGIEKPDSTSCLSTLWALDLSQANPKWDELDPCPGPERMLAVAASDGESFYLFSGTKLTPGPDGKPVREYLKDAWQFEPAQGWARLADMPRATVAAPAPATRSLDGKLLVFSGDDGARVGFKPETEHPGFLRDALAYDPVADKWTVLDEIPFSRATVPTVEWQGLTIIPNGEARPGYRSPEVWALKQQPNK